MGAANKLDATSFKVADINKTKMDPLAKVIRKKLRKLNIPRLKVVYSEEEPIKQIDDPNISCRFHCICPDKDMRKCTDRRDIPASNAWVPAAAGLIIGGKFGLTRERVRQIKEKAIRRLRNNSKNKSLKAYLGQ